MDSLSQMLATHRGQGAFVLRCAMAPPWSIRIADEASVSLLVMTAGSCTLTRGGQPPVTLGVGDVAVVCGPLPYDLADRAGRAPGVVIEPGQLCRVLDEQMGIAPLGGRSWGNAVGGPCTFLAGTYELPGQVSGRLLSAMPELAVLRAPLCDPGLVAALSAELSFDQPGQEVVVDRYIDLILVSAVRAWFASPEAKPPLWWTAQSDPVVAQVLALMHDRPAERWTLEGLASSVGYSRAGLSRRFTALVGQSPMSYLAEWRLAVAAELLVTTDASVESVARAVGYANAFAFSTAFKRAHQQSPRAYRAAA
jgi:AraC-like DNA-binding protein